MSSPCATSKKSRTKVLAAFVMHQFFGTWGVAFLAYFLGASIYDVFGFLGRTYSMRPLHWILTETPFFPVQIAVGLYSGWYLGRRLKHRSMLWVWVLPGSVLAYALIAMPNMTPLSSQMSVLAASGGPLSHYFGWGCPAKDRCLDQLLITMPFYASIAYSVGARLGLRHCHSPRIGANS